MRVRPLFTRSGDAPAARFNEKDAGRAGRTAKIGPVSLRGRRRCVMASSRECPRIAAVATRRPWSGRTTGGSVRQLEILKGLARAGRVDVLWLSPPNSTTIQPPPYLEGIRSVPYDSRPKGPLGHALWNLSALGRDSFQPYECRGRIRGEGWDSLKRGCAQANLVWFAEPLAALLTWPLVDELHVPTVIDFPDCVEERYEHELGLLSAGSTYDGNWLLRRYRRRFVRLSARVWREWSLKLSRAATRCVVTKSHDLERIDARDALVVPNGAHIHPFADRTKRRSPSPRMVFCGTLGYEPNLDAVQFLVSDIRPRLESILDQTVAIEIIGSVPDRLQHLDGIPDVNLLGYVESVDHQIRSADLVVVPLRMGSGTRLKVLEAFSLCAPVVSTSIGCDGIDAVDGVHLRIGDTPDSFARACADVMNDPTESSRLVSNAYDLVASRYDWDDIATQVADLAASLTT
jgi:glycosyltransferase involved in cell wall biosynthesis